MTRQQIASTITAATCAMVLAAAATPAWARIESESLVQLEKYCIASWRNARIDMQEWDDCTQQTLADLMSRIPRERLTVAIEDPQSTERRELTRSIWCTVQRMRRARKHISLEPELNAAPDSATQALDSDELRESISSQDAGLTDRQQTILTHVLDGWAVADIASEMEMTPARVSDEKYKAVQKLRRYFRVAA